MLVGKGMSGATDGGVPFGIWVGGNVQGVTIANLTIRDVYYHPIMLNAGAQSPLIHNVRLVNAGQQLLKSSPERLRRRRRQRHRRVLRHRVRHDEP